MAHGGKRPNTGGARKGAGRPKGSTNKVTQDVREMAQKYGPAALATLAEIMSSEESPEAARVAASRELLDRAYGKSAQSIQHSGKIDQPLVIVMDDDDQADEAAD